MENDLKYCQSCGMPLSDDYLAREADGSFNEKYCKWCWVDGAFAQECTMEEMIMHCAQFVDEFNKDSEHKVTREEAVAQMREVFPHLKRWRDVRGE